VVYGVVSWEVGGDGVFVRVVVVVVWDVFFSRDRGVKIRLD
jgi:hypothetical protein